MRTFSAAHDSHGQEHETLRTARGEHACSSITPDRSCLRILESPPTRARPAHDSYGQEHETLRTARGEHACSSTTPDRSCLRILESPAATEPRMRKPSARQLRAGARDAPHGARRACVLVDHAGSQLPAHSLRARQPRSRGCASPAHDSYGQEHETLRTARGKHACSSITPDRSCLRKFGSSST
ncbi:hypothetical protein NFJ02_38g96610 [Pycnococcus provasolii]